MPNIFSTTPSHLCAYAGDLECPNLLFEFNLTVSPTLNFVGLEGAFFNLSLLKDSMTRLVRSKHSSVSEGMVLCLGEEE